MVVDAVWLILQLLGYNEVTQSGLIPYAGTGDGTINGSGNYGFMLTATNGQIDGCGGIDKFRIKIWDKNTDEVIYDNKVGLPDDDYDAQEIAGGSIVIHNK